MQRSTGLLIMVFALAASLIPGAAALSIGISPVRIEFNDVLKGGYAERDVRISTSDAREVTGHFSEFGEITDWIRIEPDTDAITFSSTQPYTLRVIVEPPVDAANGVYAGEIRFTTDSVTSPTGAVGSAVRASVTLSIVVRITDREIRQCTAG